MQQKHSLKTIGFLSILGLLSFSCIDTAYDYDNIDPEAVLFGSSLKMPIGKASIRLDSVIGGIGIDTSILRIQDGTYTFGYSGSINLDHLTSSLNDFVLARTENVEDDINLYDGRYPSTEEYVQIPAQKYEYTSDMNLSLPSFSTDLIDVDSVYLQNTLIKITLTTEGLTGNDLDQCATISFSAQGNGAEYCDLNGNVITSWEMKPNDSFEIKLNKLNLTNGANNIILARDAVFNVKSGDDVKASTKIHSKLHVLIEYPNGVDFDRVFGRINYHNQGSVNQIHFDALGDILSENDVFDLYNPTVKITSNGNIGVPVTMDMNMKTTNSTSLATASVNNAQLIIKSTNDPNVNVVSSTTIDRLNGTSRLFKINPNIVQMDYAIQTDTNPGKFIAKNTHLDLAYAMNLPFQFGDSLSLTVGSTILENPLKNQLKELDDQDSMKIALLLNVKNYFPLQFRLELSALDKDSMELFTISSGTIESAPIGTDGFSSGYIQTKTSMSLNASNINDLKLVAGFRPRFVLQTNPANSFVTIRPSDSIDLSIGANVSGGVKIQIDPKPLSDEESE